MLSLERVLIGGALLLLLGNAHALDGKKIFDEGGSPPGAMPCAACHGAKGKAANPVYPNLAGQNADYLALSLHAYKKGERSGGQAGVMQAFTASLSDQDINDLAAYYASLTPLK